MTIKAVIYPVKAEPILPESEREGTPQPFQWFYPTSEPVREVPRSLAALLPSTVFVGEPDDFAVVFDPEGLQWFQSVVQPHGAWTPNYTWVYSVEVATVNRPLVSSWFKQVEEPVREKLRSLAAILSNGGFVGEPDDFGEDIVFDPAELQWFRPAGEPLRLVQPINVGASFAVDPLTYNPQGLQWFRATGEPVRVTARSLAALLSDGVFVGDPGGFFVYDPAELQWFRLTGEPVRLTPINPSALVGGTDGNVDILPTPPVVIANLKHRGFTQNVGKMVG